MVRVCGAASSRLSGSYLCHPVSTVLIRLVGVCEADHTFCHVWLPAARPVPDTLATVARHAFGGVGRVTTTRVEFRHAAALAKEVTTIDVLSGGPLWSRTASAAPRAPPSMARLTKASGSSTKTSTRSVVVPISVGLFHPLFLARPVLDDAERVARRISNRGQPTYAVIK
jgi:hypothetical protein